MLKFQVVENYRKYYENFISNKRILDVGCGRGDFLKEYPLAFGLDVDKKSLRRARRKARKRIVIAESTNIPFKNNTFDVIHLEFVIEHLKDIRHSFEEMERVSKSNSSFIIITTNLLNPLVFLKSIFPSNIRKIHNPFYTSYHKANTLNKLDRTMKFIGYKRVATYMWTNRESILKDDPITRKFIVFSFDCARLIFKRILPTTFLAIYSRTNRE
jgi:ubiquinone/menaquinone biosynthesis C-methylase UbiE